MKLEVVAIFWFLISGCREKMTPSLLHPFNRFFIKNLLFVLIFACFSINASAQVRASARLDTTYIFIGDQVELKLILDSAFNVKDIETDFSVFDSIPTLEVVRHGDWNPVGVNRGSGNGIYEQRVVLTSFENGRHQLPDIPVRFKLNGQPQSLDVPGRVALEVATIAVTDSTQLTPIKPIIEEGRNFQDILPYLLPILILAIIIGIVILIIQYNKDKELPLPPPPPLKPYELALQKLGILRDQELWQKGNVKQFQSTLTFIVREYLENQYHIQALEKTTDEIIEDLKRNNIAPNWQDNLRKLFQNADLVKFAKAELPVSLHEKGMQEALNFTWETKPVITQENSDIENKEPLTLEVAIEKYKSLASEKSVAAIAQHKDELLVTENGVSQKPLPVYESSIRYAGFWLRLLALLVDGFVILPVVVVIVYIRYMTFNFADFDAILKVFFITGIFVSVFGWLYFAVFESSIKQATPGKMLVNIQVTDLEGNRISFLRATGRYFAKIISTAILYIGFLMPFFTKRKQALHDLMAQCLVIKKPRHRYKTNSN